MLGLKMYDEAVKCYNIGLRLKPNDADALNNKGIALAHLENYERALECFEKCICLYVSSSSSYSSAHVDVFINKGLTLTCLKRHADAIESFNQALSIDVNNTRAHKHKVSSLCSLNKHDEAAKSFESVLKISEDETQRKIKEMSDQLKLTEKNGEKKDNKNTKHNDLNLLRHLENSQQTNIKNKSTQSLPSQIENINEATVNKMKKIRQTFRNIFI